MRGHYETDKRPAEMKPKEMRKLVLMVPKEEVALVRGVTEMTFPEVQVEQKW